MLEHVALNPSEISEIINKKIEQFDITSETRNEGTIVSVKDGIVRVHGLAEVMQGEMVEFDGGVDRQLEVRRARGDLEARHEERRVINC